MPTLKLVGEWSWYENDFVSTQPFKGLVVANLILNNWDWKTSNNKVYDVVGQQGGRASRVFVVQDLGASLGKTAYPKILSWLPMRGFGQGSRNDLADFEGQGFIKRALAIASSSITAAFTRHCSMHWVRTTSYGSVT